MKKIIVLSSVTYALRVKDILIQNGIRAELTRSPAVKSVRGCGYGVSFAPEYEPLALSLVSARGIRPVGIAEEK
ncbi:MAG: DUF3343 domain-containing protein [Clostridia bacterium]|nr:DUF3343 domain-containing protein [Clostridia bacterium]